MEIIMEHNKEESSLLTPEEVETREEIITGNLEDLKKLTRRRPVPVEVEKPKVEEVTNKIYNRGGQVCINLETQGRFALPQKLYFSDYTIEDVNNLSLSRKEDLLENLVVILNRLKNSDADCDLQDATLEEFQEILVGLKKQFSDEAYMHQWVCEVCQTDDDDQKINETYFDLNEIEYTSIEQAEIKLREFYRDLFNSIDDESFRDYLNKKYRDEPKSPDWTVDNEVESIKIKQYFYVPIKEDIYAFGFMTVGNLIRAAKIARKEFASRKHKAQNLRIHGMSLVELKQKQKDEIAAIADDEAKATILYSKALSLTMVNGKKLSDRERIDKYKDLPRKLLLGIEELIMKVEFGITGEKEFTCPMCGQVNKRSLQQELHPLLFLPFELSSSTGSGKSAGLDIYFGI